MALKIISILKNHFISAINSDIGIDRRIDFLCSLYQKNIELQLAKSPFQKSFFPKVTATRLYLDNPEYTDNLKRTVFETLHKLPPVLLNYIGAHNTKIIFGENALHFMDEYKKQNFAKLNDDNQNTLENDIKNGLNEYCSTYFYDHAEIPYAMLIAHHQGSEQNPEMVTPFDIQMTVNDTLANFLQMHLLRFTHTTEFLNHVVADDKLSAQLLLNDFDNNTISDEDFDTAHSTIDAINNDPDAYIKEHYEALLNDADMVFANYFRHYIGEYNDPHYKPIHAFEMTYPNATTAIKHILNKTIEKLSLVEDTLLNNRVYNASQKSIPSINIPA